MVERLFWIKRDGRVEEIKTDEFRRIVENRNGLVVSVVGNRINLYQGTRGRYLRFDNREMIFLSKQQTKSLFNLLKRVVRNEETDKNTEKNR